MKMGSSASQNFLLACLMGHKHYTFANVCVAIDWAGDITIARQRASNAAKTIEIGYINPKEGAVFSFGAMAIPKDAKNIVEAYQFINFLLKPENAA